MVFELLAFQSDIRFWKDNNTMEKPGWPVCRTVVAGLLLSQCVVFLYLLDSDTFLLVTVPAALGVLIQVWKAHVGVVRGGEKTQFYTSSTSSQDTYYYCLNVDL